MKNPDPEREQSERKRSLNDFLKSYNENLPQEFPLASLPLLREFRKTYPTLFKDTDEWTLDQHRKKFMDWLRQHVRSLQTVKSLVP